VVLLVGVVVTVIFVVSLFVLPQFVSGTSAPFLSIDIEATNQNVTLSHSNGDRIDVDSLEVVFRANGEQERHVFDPSYFTRGDDQTRFEPGDRWTRSHNIDADQIEVLVVHTPSNTVIDRKTGDIN